MAGPGFVAVKSASASGCPLILPVDRQEVKGIGPSALEILLRSREEKPAGSTYRPVVAPCLRHDLNT